MKIWPLLIFGQVLGEKCTTTPIEECSDCIGHCLADKADQKKCNNLGFASKKQKCKKVCNAGRIPDTCNDCRDIGRKCLKKTKMVDRCTDMGWKMKSKKCVPKQVECARPKSCNDCQNSIPACQVKFTSLCQHLGFKRKKQTCKTKCLKIMPGNCSQCERLGEACIDKANLTQRCEGLGWSAETACEERKPCRKLFPSACTVCESLGVYCIEENNVMDQCIELGLSREHFFENFFPIYHEFSRDVG